MQNKTIFDNAMHKVNQNDFESAIELFTKALVNDKANALIYYNRGVSYLNLEKLDLAIFDFNKLIELEPNNAFYFACRAFAKARSNDKKSAIADYEIAIKLDPHNPITYNNMGLVQEELGYMKQAQKSFNQSDDLRKKEEANKALNTQQNQSIKKEVEQRLNKANSDAKNNTLSVKDEQTKVEIAKSIFTNKSTFKEFIQFIKNGFKLKA